MPTSMNFVPSQSMPSHIPVFRVGMSSTHVYANGRVIRIIQGSSHGTPYEPIDRDWLALSEISFAEDWDRPEDSVYDEL